MIEIVYEKEKQKSEGNESFFRIPNNIRQIGEVGGTQKIYIEDYAYTYLCRISSENLSKGIGAVLLGQANWKEGISYLFVKVLFPFQIWKSARNIWNLHRKYGIMSMKRTKSTFGSGDCRLVFVYTRVFYGTPSDYLPDSFGSFRRQ